MRPYFSLYLFLFVCFVGESSFAYEIYSFVEKNCSVHSGFVVHLEDSQIQLLNLDGQSEVIQTTEVETILVFDVVSDPILSIGLSPVLAKSMRVVTVGEEQETSFLAWPVRFMDSLVMFYDDEGKIHVFEMDAIHKLRFVNDSRLFEKSKNHNAAVKPRLDLGQASLTCPKLSQTPQAGTRPTRVLSDQIKIQQFMQDLESNFRDLESFQERTYLYAKPYLYDHDNRFGFTYYPRRLERTADLPMFIQWTTGSPYRFQSSTVIGTTANEFSPNAEPFAQIRSDLKAHVFHALFVGNLVGLSEGASLYSHGFDSDSVVKEWGATESQIGLNYMALIGGDYGPFSLSMGSFFPTIGIRSGFVYREILSSHISYALRAMMTTKSWRVHAIGSIFGFDSNSPGENEIKIPFSSQFPTQFNFKGKFFRGGIDYQYKSLKASADYILNVGDYSEVGPDGSFNHSFNNSTISLGLKNEFESTVALGVLVNINDLKTHSTFSPPAVDTNITDVRYGGLLEFLF